jgi:hypothetical protein
MNGCMANFLSKKRCCDGADRRDEGLRPTGANRPEIGSDVPRHRAGPAKPALAPHNAAERQGAAMHDPVDALVIDLLEWLGPEGRPYREVMDAWRTSCPRLPVWETANERGLIALRRRPGFHAEVLVSPRGRQLVRRRRRSQPAPLLKAGAATV